MPSRRIMPQNQVFANGPPTRMLLPVPGQRGSVPVNVPRSSDILYIQRLSRVSDEQRLFLDLKIKFQTVTERFTGATCSICYEDTKAEAIKCLHCKKYVACVECATNWIWIEAASPSCPCCRGDWKDLKKGVVKIIQKPSLMISAMDTEIMLVKQLLNEKRTQLVESNKRKANLAKEVKTLKENAAADKEKVDDLQQKLSKQHLTAQKLREEKTKIQKEMEKVKQDLEKAKSTASRLPLVELPSAQRPTKASAAKAQKKKPAVSKGALENVTWNSNLENVHQNNNLDVHIPNEMLSTSTQTSERTPIKSSAIYTNNNHIIVYGFIITSLVLIIIMLIIKYV
ncbi:unnamed protein product [Bursaphelenchus okinawaensis]|uniref:RING-type domain-containing protein n=1 Tax=Bursaphelenchus okinawaensis TaxID=465554 RepID=A0A811KS20_9BILA|nr:unnamed protein product [Bursaphelenchus okinawaensis]CAG9110781.1 unnamed protein product [Bursaphelenchus okinawaensis]